MAAYVRAKRVTDPLDDRVKACICGADYRRTGYVSSSGSEHEAEDSSLGDLIFGFLEEEDDDGDDAAASHEPENPECSDGDGSVLDPTDSLVELLNPTVRDRFRTKLLSCVSKAVDEFTSLRSNRSAFRRAVMASLRDSGYDAGICKTRWERSGKMAAGNYEFVDVVKSGVGKPERRYLIDVDFAEEFAIARPTEKYLRLLEVLPRVYVGRPEELKQVVRILSEAAKRSLRSGALHQPPWRKNRYMQAKWLGPYRRTVGQIPVNSAASDGGDSFAVKCRTVGFKAERVLVPAATPTG